MVGTTLGGYVLGVRIGRGGLSEVYRARHRTLGHHVAVKLLSANSSINRGEDRLLREARMLAALHHPGIVQVIDVGRLGSRPFIVMELLNGIALTDLIGEPLPVNDVLAFGSQIASALSACHQAGMVHRDLSPSNIIIVPDPDLPGGRRAKIVDFGLSKRPGPRNPATDFTSTGIVIGTPHYMSPEQCSGASIDGRSDLYSLGLVLYEMLLGRRAFEDVVSTSELLDCQAYAAVPPIASIRPDVPPALIAAIDTCVAKDPSRRFQDAGALAEALTRAADGRNRATPNVRAPSVTMQVRLPASRTPRFLAAMLVTPALVVGALWWMSYDSSGESESKTPAWSHSKGTRGGASNLDGSRKRESTPIRSGESENKEYGLEAHPQAAAPRSRPRPKRKHIESLERRRPRKPTRRQATRISEGKFAHVETPTVY